MADQTSETKNEAINILEILVKDIGPFPLYIINLLKFLGYDNFLSLKDFGENDVNEIEQFARNTLFQLIENPTTENLKQYYGVFHMNPKIFSIMPGHRKVLLNLKRYLEEKGRNYFYHYNENRPNLLLKRHICNNSQYKHEDDLEFDDQNDSNDDVDGKKMKYDPLLAVYQSTEFIPEDHDVHIRHLVNKWLALSIPKLHKNLPLDNLEDYTLVFNHKPQEGKLTASLQCSLCKHIIGIASQLRKTGSFRWLISNYMRHVKKRHFIADTLTNVSNEVVMVHTGAGTNNVIMVPPVPIKLEFDQYADINAKGFNTSMIEKM